MPKSRKMSYNLDDLVESIGTFGRWHAGIYTWIAAIVFFRAMVQLSIIFMIDTPPFICDSGLLANSSGWTFEQARNISTPLKEDIFDGCFEYDLNYTQLRNFGFNESLYRMPTNLSDLKTQSCVSGYYFDYNFMQRSVVTQWNLVCDKSIWLANTQSVYMFGMAIGIFISGFLADRFGRKPVIVIMGSVSAIIAVADSFIGNFYIFLAVRFFLGVFLNGTPLYALAFELANSKLRNFIGAFYWAAYSIGAVGLALLAYIVRDWRSMHAISAAPLLILFPISYWVLPESPRWLASKNQTSQAVKILSKIAIINGANELVISEDQMTNSSENSTLTTVGNKRLTYFYFLGRPRQLLRLLIIFYIWFANSVVYYGILLLITDFSGNIFLNNAISGATDLPAYGLLYVLLLWSRKKAQMLCLAVAGLLLISSIFIPASLSGLQLAAALLGKLAVTASYSFCYVITNELYPSAVRAGFLMSADMVATLGGMLAPYLANIARIIPNTDIIKTPLLLYGVISMSAVVLELWIPETQDQNMPETLDDLHDN